MRADKRVLWLALMGTYLWVPGCGTDARVEGERVTPSSISERIEPRSSHLREQGRPRSEFLLKFEREDEETVRLQPRVFESLPTTILQELERWGCTIPQVYTEQGHGNVIKGHFTAPGQVDLAVLCSRERVSSILVFRNSATADIAELAAAPDLHYLQDVGDGRIGYSRAIGVTDSEYIKLHYEAYGGLKPPPMDHEGIEDAFIEKASKVWYWHRGQWWLLDGAD